MPPCADLLQFLTPPQCIVGPSLPNSCRLIEVKMFYMRRSPVHRECVFKTPVFANDKCSAVECQMATWTVLPKVVTFSPNILGFGHSSVWV